MGPDGALKAAIEARDAGLVRFIGVTGHGPMVAKLHLRSLERHPFDSVLLPYNFVEMQKPDYSAEFEQLYRVCQERGVAMQTIKGATRRPWGEHEHTRATWYEPFEEQSDVDLAVSWVLGRPGIFLNTAGDINVLPRILDAASRFTAKPTDEQMQDLAARREMATLFPV